MDLGYDIFRKLDDGAPLWIRQVSDLNEAKKILETLVRSSPGEYFIRDAAAGAIVFNLGPVKDPSL
jgi:hypothetical protein